MAVIIIDENSETGKELMEIIHSYEERGGDSVQICNESELEEIFSGSDTLHEPMADYQAKTIEDIPFKRIPGLPYTHEERMASLRRAEEQRRLGLSITSEEFDEEMETW
ncbi:MAG: hypothetical protein LBV74_06060 [Tannerella sp.]|jgi:hypothetical protein|nr:hypothetical protein [Tannerella sp.]